MGVKFEITATFKIGRKKNAKYFVCARSLDKESKFEVTDNSSLGKVEISRFLSQPRAIDEKGNPKLDLFIFKIRYKKDCDELREGQVVELVNKNKLG